MNNFQKNLQSAAIFIDVCFFKNLFEPLEPEAAFVKGGHWANTRQVRLLVLINKETKIKFDQIFPPILC